MSVSQKLTAFRKSGEKASAAERITAIKNMDLETLEKETIQFGKAHRDQPFPEAFENHGWTDWFVKTYEWSGKESHVKFLTYVEKRLDREIQQGPHVAPKAKAVVQKALAKPKSTAQGSETSQAWTKVTADEIESDTDEELMLQTRLQVHDVEERMQLMAQENAALSQRMNGIEMALHELVHHVKNLGIKQEQ